MFHITAHEKCKSRFGFVILSLRFCLNFYEISIFPIIGVTLREFLNLMIPVIHIEDYNYGLEDARIAKYPLQERDASKLLHYRKGSIQEYHFRDLPDLLPEKALMVFNDTKVVPARLHFQRETGAHIEVFCLEPVQPVEYNLAFAATDSCTWKCVIGNAKKWKDDILHLYNPADDAEIAALGLTATLLEREGQTGKVCLRWLGGIPFSTVLEKAGTVPIPPYLNRESEAIDTERYQTLYAHIRGSVAAPTAGLHFTETVMERIRAKGIDMETVCLHVGAGTFQPVKSDNIGDHDMHTEFISVPRDLLAELATTTRPVIAVGTTSVRTLESLYYIGQILDANPDATEEELRVTQWMPYTTPCEISPQQALQNIVDYLDRHHASDYLGSTQLMIAPGCTYRIVKGMITNFHQPQSTLLLLVAAFVGNDNWRKIYDYALDHDFRFLSYGDACLFL